MAGVHCEINLAAFLHLLPRFRVLSIDAATAETADIDRISDDKLEIVLLGKGLGGRSVFTYQVRDGDCDVVLGDNSQEYVYRKEQHCYKRCSTQ